MALKPNRPCRRKAMPEIDPELLDNVALDVTPRVRRLIIAAREVAFDEHPTKEALKELDRASSAFAEDVPWDDEPMTVEAEPLA